MERYYYKDENGTKYSFKSERTDLIPITEEEFIRKEEVVELTEEQKKQIAEEEYKQNIVNKIRKKYSLSDELAIIRQRNVKTEEFDEYYEFVEKCKSEAKAELNRE